MKLRQVLRLLLTVLSKSYTALYVTVGTYVCTYRAESSLVPSIPAPVENKQLPANVTAFGVPVFEAHKGNCQEYCICSYSHLEKSFEVYLL